MSDGPFEVTASRKCQQTTIEKCKEFFFRVRTGLPYTRFQTDIRIGNTYEQIIQLFLFAGAGKG